ncbi:hypothetical protein I3843_03G170900 [Carya illinoinensis]|nr:hypothetical protein I3843_03G170900 [Carya illinoinensis]
MQNKPRVEVKNNMNEGPSSSVTVNAENHCIPSPAKSLAVMNAFGPLSQAVIGGKQLHDDPKPLSNISKFVAKPFRLNPTSSGPCIRLGPSLLVEALAKTHSSVMPKS